MHCSTVSMLLFVLHVGKCAVELEVRSPTEAGGRCSPCFPCGNDLVGARRHDGHQWVSLSAAAAGAEAHHLPRWFLGVRGRTVQPGQCLCNPSATSA